MGQEPSIYNSNKCLPVHDGFADSQVSLDGDGQGHVDGSTEGDWRHWVQEVDVKAGEDLEITKLVKVKGQFNKS